MDVLVERNETLVCNLVFHKKTDSDHYIRLNSHYHTTILTEYSSALQTGQTASVMTARIGIPENWYCVPINGFPNSTVTKSGITNYITNTGQRLN